ncbi:uncharacterized protein V6R79_025942 [Siganus canaliculatus]
MRVCWILLFLQLWGNPRLSSSQTVGPVCSVLPRVSHAFVSDDTKRDLYPEGHEIHFTCEVGYISGPTIRYLCSNSEWIALRRGKCYLKPCGLPDDTPNGHYLINDGEEFVFGTTITYHCNEGYQMVSKESNRTCLLDGWSNHVPVCEPVRCDPPPEDGELTVKGSLDDGEAVLPDRFITFSCNNPRKVLNGSAVLICGTDGKWNNPFPTCEDITCTVPAMHQYLVAAQLPATERVKVGHTFQFDCSNGFTLEGAQHVECLETGQWSAPFPTCAERCKVTGIPDSVYIRTRGIGSSVNIGQELQFSCRNYRNFLHGEKTVQCLADGKWSHPFPTCGAPLGCNTRPPALEHGRIMSFVRSYYKHNETVQYTCQNFYKMEGDGYMKCVNGEWSGRMRCFKPCTVTREEMELRNIYFTFRPREPTLFSFHGGSLTFTCVPGTSHDGRVAMGPKCVDEITCPRHIDENALCDNETQDEFKYNVWVNCNCKEGYEGSYSLTCEDRGWTGYRACQEITCPRHIDEDAICDGETLVEFKYNDQVNCNCKESFEDRYTLTCGEHGWTGYQACARITCPVEDIRYEVENAVIDDRKRIYYYNDTVNYKCNEGYRGSPYRVCKETGWIGDSQCTEITCLRHIDENAICDRETQDEFKYDARVYCICKGFRGQYTLTCGERGWTGHLQCGEMLTDITCPRHIDDNAICEGGTLEEFKFNDQVKCNCKKGSGQTYTLTCGEHGWTGYQPCTETCPRHIDEDAICDGETQYEFKYDDQISCNCKEGFRGRYTLTCGEHGWTGYRACERITCPVEDIRNALIIDRKQRYYYNDTVNYKCNEGYRGSPYRVCKAAGWIGDSQCTEMFTDITCPRHIDENAICDGETQDEFKFNDQVNCNCKGFWGRYTLTCGERGWTGYKPCRETTCPRHIDEDAVCDGETQDEFKYDDQISCNCKEGFRGRYTLTCGEHGWTGYRACTKMFTDITCPRHIDENAICDGETQDEFKFNDQVNCNCKGFWGRYTLTCGERGWTGYKPCRETTCPRHIDENAICDGETQDEFKFNDQINCNCKEGFRGRYTLTCGEHGWTGYRACERITCPVEDIRNALIIDRKHRYYYNDTVNYKCNEGYRGSPYRVCKAAGWFGDSQCTEITCPRHIDEDAVCDGETRDEFKYNDQVHCNCKESFEDSYTLTCGDHGWTGYQACERECKITGIPDGVNIHPYGITSLVRVSQQLTFSCRNHQHVLRGEKTVECLADGKWSHPFPTCAGGCKITGIPDGVNIHPYGITSLVRVSQQLTFSCRNHQHVLRGEKMVECLADGKWSHPFPTCGDPLGCNKPPTLENGDTKESVQHNYRQNEKVQYVCQHLYKMEGDGFMQCVNEPCTVTVEEVRTQNIYFTNKPHETKLYIPHNDFLSVSCVSGTSHYGRVSMRQQCVDGVVTLPTCQ